MKNIRNIIGWTLLTLVVVLGGIASCQQRKISLLKDTVERLDWNVQSGQDSIKQYKSQYGNWVNEKKVLQMTVSEFKRYGRKEDRDLIKDLKLKAKNVKQITRIQFKTRDSIVYVPKANGCFDYKDKWLEIHACKNERDSFMTIDSTDSIGQALEVVYKWKFLWMRGKVVGVNQHIVNYNPNSKLKYSSTIMLQK